MPQKVYLQAWVERDQREFLGKMAEETDRSIASLVREALKDLKKKYHGDNNEGGE